jgi:hypothetical protein
MTDMQPADRRDIPQHPQSDHQTTIDMQSLSRDVARRRRREKRHGGGDIGRQPNAAKRDPRRLQRERGRVDRPMSSCVLTDEARHYRVHRHPRRAEFDREHAHQRLQTRFRGG